MNKRHNKRAAALATYHFFAPDKHAPDLFNSAICQRCEMTKDSVFHLTACKTITQIIRDNWKDALLNTTSDLFEEKFTFRVVNKKILITSEPITTNILNLCAARLPFLREQCSKTRVFLPYCWNENIALIEIYFNEGVRIKIHKTYFTEDSQKDITNYLKILP